MTITIIILAYVANIFLTRFFTYLAVKNEGRHMSVTYSHFILWFIPIIGNIACFIDWLTSINYDNRSWFTGKNW